MAKHPQDNKTMELLPMPAKRGRKPKGDKAMTPAQRMAAYRARQKDNPVKMFEFSKEELLLLDRALMCLADSGRLRDDPDSAALLRSLVSRLY